ncbi:MAG: hypothetical protein F8N37_00355 [Telmatospirillum sp.]|nr:hypothetical protein [Telmatospirillum sp.]
MRYSALIVLCSVAFGGCAMTEAVVDIPYVQDEAASISGAKPVNLSVIDGRTEDRTRISTKTNGYGAEMGAIRPSRSVVEVVESAMSSELAARGVGRTAAGLPISVTVKRFYSQFHTTSAEGQVGLDITIRNPAGQPVFSRQYQGTSSLGILVYSGSNAAEAVSAALKDAMAKVFSDRDFLDALAGG